MREAATVIIQNLWKHQQYRDALDNRELGLMDEEEFIEIAKQNALSHDCFDRSEARERIVLFLESIGEVDAGDIADACSVPYHLTWKILQELVEEDVIKFKKLDGDYRKYEASQN